MLKWLPAAALLLLASPALAEMELMCGDLQKVLGVLSERMGQQPRGYGAGDGRHYILMVSPDGKFTIILVPPDGNACLLGGGEKWREVEARPADKGA
jgi:hypothetical protein